MSIVVTEPKSLALEILDLETDIFATTDKNTTIEVPHAELFTVHTDEGAIQLTQTEHYWQSPFATRPSLLHFLTRPRVKITVPTGTFLDALRVRTSSYCTIGGMRASYADLAATEGTIRCRNSDFSHVQARASSASVLLANCTVDEDASLKVAGGAVLTVGTFDKMPGYRVREATGSVEIFGKQCRTGDSYDAENQPSVYITCSGGHVEVE